MKQIICITLVLVGISCNQSSQPVTEKPNAFPTSIDFIEHLKVQGIVMKHPADSDADCFHIPVEAYENKVKAQLEELQNQGHYYTITEFNDTAKTCRVCVINRDSLPLH